MKKLLPLILILFAAPSLCFGESYLCTGDKTTGLDASKNFQQKKFEHYNWEIKEGSGKYVYQVMLHGTNDVYLNCYKDEQRDENVIQCRGTNSTLIFSKVSSRYVYNNIGSYIFESNTDDVITEIGTCAKF